jgi:O-antigen ligase
MALKTGRFAELYVSILAASKSPILGLGPWGENSELRDPTRERTSTFTHSSYVHMFVKAGLVGLILWVVMLLRYVIWWVRRRRADWNDPRHRAIAEAFFCGFLFWIPDSVFGTPIIIYRHFQILAMLLAIPIIAHVIDKRQEDGNQLAIKAS